LTLSSSRLPPVSQVLQNRAHPPKSPRLKRTQHMDIRTPLAGRKDAGPSGTKWVGVAFRCPLLLLTGYLCAIYAPSAGHGFIKDDFGWIANSTVTSAHDVVRLFASNVGFYRPAVSLTFGFNHLVFGLAPLGYGLTNLALVLLTVLAIRSLTVSIG